jgi:mono/diheme cytochrome c family protein
MRNSAYYFLIVAGMLLLIIACSKTSEDKLSGGGNTCDTTSVSYSTDILPILESNCYGCHGSGNTGGSGGISLDGYSNLKVYADNGFLVGNVRHDAGFVGMPYGLPKLPDCEVNKIVAWVNQGAENN